MFLHFSDMTDPNDNYKNIAGDNNHDIIEMELVPLNTINQRDREERMTTQESIDINDDSKAEDCDDCKKVQCEPCAECPPEEKNNYHCPHYCKVNVYTIGIPQLIMLAIGVILYIVDVTSDLLLVHGYFKEGHYAWGGLTVTFVAVSAFINPFFPIVIICNGYLSLKMEICFSILLLATCTLIGPILIALYILYSRFKLQHKTKDLAAEIFDESSIFLVTVQFLEAFLECCPQMLLQLYIMLSQDFTGLDLQTGQQMFSICTSLLALSWAMVKWHQREHQEKSYTFPWQNTFLTFCWQMCIIAPRVLAMALFASVYKWGLFIFCAIHYLIMLVYMFVIPHINKHFIRDKKYQVEYDVCDTLIRVLWAATWMFTFYPAAAASNSFKQIGSVTCPFYALFYILVYIENAILTFLWFHGTHNPHTNNYTDLPINETIIPGFTTDTPVPSNNTNTYIVYYNITTTFLSPPDVTHDIHALTIVAFVVVFGVFFLGILFMWLHYAVCYPRELKNYIEYSTMWRGHRWMHQSAPGCWEMCGWCLGPQMWRKAKKHKDETHITFQKVKIKNPINPQWNEGVLADPNVDNTVSPLVESP